MTVNGEYRVTAAPGDPDRVLVRWRPSDDCAVWVHIAIEDDIHAASVAMEEHRDKGCVQ